MILSNDKLLNGFWACARSVHTYAGKACTLLLTRLLALLSKLPWTGRLGILHALMAAAAISVGISQGAFIFERAMLQDEHLRVLQESGFLITFHKYCVLLSAVGILLGFNAAVLAFLRSRLSLYIQRAATCGFVVLWVYGLFFIVEVPKILHAESVELFDKASVHQFIYGLFIRWLPFFIVSLISLLCLVLIRVRKVYDQRTDDRELIGDQILDNLQRHGEDPPYRTSVYWSWFFHLLVFILPILMMRGCGLVTPYDVPAGGGEQVIQKIVVKKIQKKKPELVLNMNSPILYYVPDLDDSDVVQELDQETLDTYQASQIGGGLGKGGGKGGWPNGMENVAVRFLRLQYSGGDWDQDMGKGADYNFLLKFRELTGFKVAGDTESVRMADLKRFPEGRSPPFVFITGGGGIRATDAEIKVLREYVLKEGGMIFADNGGGNFNAHFRNLMRRTFPQLNWVDISNDDIIYRVPYAFPEGAPPLWSHSGRRAMGLKKDGRWIVFYHQGDINDAWKTGHSGADPRVAQQAYRLGVNVVNYAFNQYLDRHHPSSEEK